MSRSRTGWSQFLVVTLAGLLALAAGPIACTTKVPRKEPADDKPAVRDKGKTDPKVGDLQVGKVLEVPFILWGGDVATFHANGGLETRSGTLFHKHGLKIKLTREDNFDKQVEKYLAGKSPFLRGTMSMLGQAAETLAADKRTRPVVFLQLTWSAGDHLVARAPLKTLADLKGKKIALQEKGPHVGMLQDILRTARLDWKDVTPVWTSDVTGDKGPAALFRKDGSIDACFAITPDMMDLNGGLDKKGSGAKKSVKDAHVLVSTAYMSRSIADVYACRKDFYDKYKEQVEKFAAGYLKASEELVAMRREFHDKKDSPAYKAILKMTEKIYGKDDIPDEDAADGLISDAAFVGLPGNKSFFTDKGNLSGFRAKQDAGLDVAIALGNATRRSEFLTADFDYDALKKLGELTGKAIPENRFRDNVTFLTRDTIYYFTITFEPNVSKFPEAIYGAGFQRALEMASLFGNAVMAVRGHADPMSVLERYRDTGLAKGMLKKGKKAYQYVLKDGTEFDLRDAKKVVELIKKDNFGDNELDKGVKYLQTLSQDRANAVRLSVVNYAKTRGYRLDLSQIRSVGVGMVEPIVALPDRGTDPKLNNRRVEFRIIKVAPESINIGDIDY